MTMTSKVKKTRQICTKSVGIYLTGLNSTYTVHLHVQCTNTGTVHLHIVQYVELKTVATT